MTHSPAPPSLSPAPLREDAWSLVFTFAFYKSHMRSVSSFLQFQETESVI